MHVNICQNEITPVYKGKILDDDSSPAGDEYSRTLRGIIKSLSQTTTSDLCWIAVDTLAQTTMDISDIGTIIVQPAWYAWLLTQWVLLITCILAIVYFGIKYIIVGIHWIYELRSCVEMTCARKWLANHR